MVEIDSVVSSNLHLKGDESFKLWHLHLKTSGPTWSMNFACNLYWDLLKTRQRAWLCFSAMVATVATSRPVRTTPGANLLCHLRRAKIWKYKIFKTKPWLASALAPIGSSPLAPTGTTLSAPDKDKDKLLVRLSWRLIKIKIFFLAMAIKIKINYWCESLRIYYKLFNFFGHLSATLPWHRLALLDWLLDWLVLARLLWHL